METIFKCWLATVTMEIFETTTYLQQEEKEQVDITISKNQALQILYLVYSLFNSVMIQYYSFK